MIRTILSVSFAVLYLILGIPVLIAEFFIGKFNKRARDISCLRMVQWALRTISKICGIRLTVIGKENIPQDQAVLYIANHRSYFDIILSYSLCPDLTGYIAKDSLRKVPLLSNWMKRVYCLFMDRTDIKQSLKTILQGVDHIKNGISVCIFPEGTRNHGKETELLPFKEGSFKIAEKTGCPIIPMAISNSASVIADHPPKVTPCHIIIEYGKPIYVEDLPKNERRKVGLITRDKIQEMLVRNQQLV